MPSRSLLCLLLPLLLAGSGASAQSPPVCPANRYGNAAQAAAIEATMQRGGAAAVRAALLAAQRTRGVELGCAESSYGYGAGAPDTAPDLSAIRAAFARHQTVATEAAAQYDRCPGLGRQGGAYALGGWRARSGGLDFDLAALRRITDNLVETQYLPSRTPGSLASWPGLFAYAEALGQSGDACFVPGVVGEGVGLACTEVAALCVDYRQGRFAGRRFVIGDYSAAAGVRDGGAGFDQGWAGVMMVEAAIADPDPDRRERYRRAALAAGDWALAEPPVRNHNYTAKLVWLLAVLYDWTGEPRYREGLIDKLERNLLPGVLMDQDGDGEIDGLPGLRFADLRAPAARRPGRMWDAHNALPWYQAMNAWALAEAYAAFRDRGDAEWAAKLRPYALATLDNLAAELAPAEALPPQGPGVTQVAYAMATGLSVIATPEGLARPQWESVLWRLWNAGLGAAPGDNKTATAALVTLRAEQRPARSAAARALAQRSGLPLDGRVSGAWYDPSRSGEGWLLVAPAPGRLLVGWYSYHPTDAERQVWIVAEGNFDGRVFDVEAYLTRGTRFGANLDPAQVQRLPWGRVRIDFDDCRRASLHWTSTQAGYGSGQRALQRLAAIDGLPCAP